MPNNLRSLMQSLTSLSGVFQQSMWQPLVDIYRTREGWVLKFELAGVRSSDFELLVSGRTLTVRGCRYDWLAHEAWHSYSMEIAYNCFERSVRLPCDIDPSGIRTEYRDGMLLVRIATPEVQR